jgi:hypothetical protein
MGQVSRLACTDFEERCLDLSTATKAADVMPPPFRYRSLETLSIDASWVRKP